MNKLRCSLILLLTWVPYAQAQEGGVWDNIRILAEEQWNAVQDTAPLWIEIAQQNIGNLPAITPGQIDHLTRVFSVVSQSLHSMDLDALPPVRDHAEQALAFMDQYPALANYADWARQRLDYIDMAERALHAFRPEPVAAPPSPPPPVQRPPTQAPTPPRTPAPSTPPPRPPAQTQPKSPSNQREKAAKEAKTRQVEFASNVETWKRRLKDRPAPARAAKLLPECRRAFESAGIPTPLVWVAEVESSFNPEARSPVGALGLYQFMPRTAVQLGLRVDDTVDERLHPGKSAHAAGKYLRYLHGRFGDWPLALAAYNYGEGNVNKLLRQAPRRDFSSIAHKLPNETRMYVPKVLATLSLRDNIDHTALPAPTR